MFFDKICPRGPPRGPVKSIPPKRRRARRWAHRHPRTVVAHCGARLHCMCAKPVGQTDTRTSEDREMGAEAKHPIKNLICEILKSLTSNYGMYI